ncbi:MAG: calcium/sodium antiporter [Micavibrio sp.]|nr:calcium/sodium antiporter [Micavibrio sp.]
MGIGIGLLLKGGDWTVNSAVFIAQRFGLSPMVVGFTILAFGTSLPELIVSLLATMRGSGGIAMGNVIGSNIANILLVLGTCAVFAGLRPTINKSLLRDITMMIITAFLLLGLMYGDEISRVAGFMMVAFLLAYIFYQYRASTRQGIDEKEIEKEIEEDVNPNFTKPLFAYGFLALGLACVSGGAECLVRGAEDFAGTLGVPQAVIGLSIIAIGTSLPELSTSIIAAKKGHTDMLLGNIIGSNVFNVLIIIGITASITPIPSNAYAGQLLNFDIWVMIATCLFFTAYLLIAKNLNAVIGALFLAAYIGYNVYIYAINLSVPS